MKKRLCVLLILALIFTSGFAFASTDTAEAAPAKTHLSKTSVTMTIGTNSTLKLLTGAGKTISPEKVTWKSGNTESVLISATGKISALSEGTAKVTAKYKGKTYTCTVQAKYAKLKFYNKALDIGDIAAQVLYTPGGSAISASKSAWQSGNEDIAEVSEDGIITAKKSGRTTITAVYKNVRYTAEIVVRGDETEEDRAYRSRLAVYWGLPEDIEWIEEPKSIDDYDNNILYSFLTGNYSLDFEFDNSNTAQLFQRIVATRISYLSTSFPELMGSYCNGIIRAELNYADGSDKLICSISVNNAALTDEELYKQQLSGLETALSISKDLHERGMISTDMSAEQIARVYYNYLNTLGVEAVDIMDTPSERGKYMMYDSVYGCLVFKQANCVGRAAAYNILMHIEGISSQSVAGVFRSSREGHVLNRLILNGTEYFCDWGNRLPLQTQGSLESIFEFDGVSLNYARTHTN